MFSELWMPVARPLDHLLLRKRCVNAGVQERYLESHQSTVSGSLWGWGPASLVGPQGTPAPPVLGSQLAWSGWGGSKEGDCLSHCFSSER